MSLGTKEIISINLNQTENGEEEEREIENHEARKSSESDDKVSEQRHKLSLKFLCEDTSPSDRRICEYFWKMIDTHPEMRSIMVMGRSEYEEVPQTNLKSKPAPKTPCEHLQEFMAKDVDKLVVAGLKEQKKPCIIESNSQLSLSGLCTELDSFDSKVKTEYSIPPKPPRPTPSQLLYIMKNQTPPY